MREILFRGKRSDTGDWVKGFYVQKPNPFSEGGKPIRHCIVDLPPFGYDVDPETVGQFTGLTDKNGKRIFEGDIVNMDDEDWSSLGYTYQICAVRFDDFTGGFEPFSTYDWDSSEYIRASHCEVVGNIYDNPDMLEGGADE